MTFAPIDMMMARVQRNTNSDYEMFVELLYAGEFIVKLTTALFVSAIEDDRERHRYSLLHALVRADGLGEWAGKLEEALAGPASHHLAAALTEERRVFTERVGSENWQYNAVKLLHLVLAGVNPSAQPLPAKVNLRAWFTMFAELRNKTRGHGAITPANCAKLAPLLDESIGLVTALNPVFRLPWAYLHRNLSGRYNVVSIGGDRSAFSNLTTASAAEGENYLNGVYVSAGRLRRVELLHSDLDASDFFLPNGAFNGKTYELHSLITDSRIAADAGPYLAIAGARPASETEGKGDLDIIGGILGNIPAVPAGYVRRPQLEAEVRSVLSNDRHPIVTLVGRGGIGKTSVALTVLHEIANTDRYSLILWFSARDIDLTTTGPKVVQPRVLAEDDIAIEYCALIEPAAAPHKKTVALVKMAEHMRSSPLGPTLFVFDNFETARSPVDLFQWIDTNVRLPNKIVITSRFRDFKADFPISVAGMEKSEAENLIAQTADALGITDLVGSRRRDQIIEESDGHPYIIKIILGEIASTGMYEKPSSLIVRKDDILDALFDRTYANLSPMAERIFLTLSGWRSLVPRLAIEAVLLWRASETGDPERAIEDLVRMSFVERTLAEDGSDFLGVPLTAAIFGTKKLEVSPYRELIENDIRFLQDIGATSRTGLKGGIGPRITNFFKNMARRITKGTSSIDELAPVLEFIARSYPPAWLLLAELEQETLGEGGFDRAANHIRRYLEEEPQSSEAQRAWQRLISIYRTTKNVVGGCSAFLRAAEIQDLPLYQISNMANWLNNEREIINQMDIGKEVPC